MQVVEMPDPKFTPHSVAFSPDGRWLATWAWGNAYVFDTLGSTTPANFGQRETTMMAMPGVGFTADSRAVIVHRNNAKPPVHVYDIESGAILRRCPENHGYAAEVGPGGRLVYLSHDEGQHWVEIVRWDPLTGETLPAFGRHGGLVRQFAISADEKWVASSSGKGVRIWNLGGTKLPSRCTRRLQLPKSRHVSGLTLSSDGKFVAYNEKSIGIGNTTTGEIWQVTEQGPGHSKAVAFHPTRPILAWCVPGGEVGFFDATTRTELKRFVWGFEKHHAICFSPDGLRCAAAGTGKVVIWDVDV